MPIKATKIELIEDPRTRLEGLLHPRTHYEVSHSSKPGEDKEYTTLEQLLILDAAQGKFTCSMRLEEMAPQETPDEALDKMAEWLRRMASAIEERKPVKGAKIVTRFH